MRFIIYWQKYSCIGIEYIPLEVLNKIKINWLLTMHLRWIQDDESIMCGFYNITFIEYMVAGETLLDYTSSFSPND